VHYSCFIAFISYTDLTHVWATSCANCAGHKIPWPPVGIVDRIVIRAYYYGANTTTNVCLESVTSLRKHARRQKLLRKQRNSLKASTESSAAIAKKVSTHATRGYTVQQRSLVIVQYVRNRGAKTTGKTDWVILAASTRQATTDRTRHSMQALARFRKKVCPNIFSVCNLSENRLRRRRWAPTQPRDSTALVHILCIRTLFSY